jgi:hypothetical protein
MAPNTWRVRWGAAVEQLTAVRSENKTLREALDALNEETEAMFSAAGQGGIESAKSHLISQQRNIIRKYKQAEKEGPTNV